MRIHLQPRQKKTLGVLVVGGIIVCTLCAVGTTYVGIRRHAFVSYPESAYQQTSFSSGSTDILAVVPQANMPTAQSVYKGAVSSSVSSSVSPSMSPSVSSSMSPSRSVSMSSSVSPSVSSSVSRSPSVSSGALVTVSDRTIQSYGSAYGASYGGAYGGTIRGGVSARQQSDVASGSVSMPSIPTIAYRGSSMREKYGLTDVEVDNVTGRGTPTIHYKGGQTTGGATPPGLPLGSGWLPILLCVAALVAARIYRSVYRNKRVKS